MTKIRIDDGKSEPKKSAAAKTAKPAAKVAAARPISSASTHNTVQKSATLSRRYVKKPAAVSAPLPADLENYVEITSAKQARKLVAKREQTAKAAKLAQAQAVKAAKLAKKQTALQMKTGVKTPKTTPKPVKNVKKSDRALIAASKATKTASLAATVAEPAQMQQAFKKKNKGRRIFFALACSAATVGALVAFIHFSMPDISVRVAAIQTGIEATYPTFIPRNYSLANVTSDKDGIVTMYFKGPDGATFSLSEEKSTWDSTALLNNFVKKNYPSDFTTLREQGITIYVRGENASWVNGGLLYKITSTGKYLTKEQIRNIATSL